MLWGGGIWLPIMADYHDWANIPNVIIRTDQNFKESKTSQPKKTPKQQLQQTIPEGKQEEAIWEN